jgi:hypothetical protein
MDVNENTLPPGVSASGLSGASADSLGGGDWEVGDCLGTWWRPNYETYMVSPAPCPFRTFVLSSLSLWTENTCCERVRNPAADFKRHLPRSTLMMADVLVPLHPASCYETERMQETLLDPYA